MSSFVKGVVVCRYGLVSVAYHFKRGFHVNLTKTQFLMAESLLHLHYKDKIINVVSGDKLFFSIVHWEESRSGVLMLFAVCNITRFFFQNQ